MSRAVWDASALLLVLLQEPGWEGLAEDLERAALSSVNLAEVATKLIEAGLPAREVREILGNLNLEIVDFDSVQAYASAELREPTRSRGLSLGDRACLALASRLGLRVLTADRAWADLPLGIEIELVR